MGLHITLDNPHRPVMTADRALWADADGKIVSGEDDPAAAQLVAGAGQPIPPDIQDRYGLAIAKGDKVVQRLPKPEAADKPKRATQQRQAAANPQVPHVHHDDAADAAAKAQADADAQAAADAQAKADADAAEEAAREAAAVKAAEDAQAAGAKQATPENTKEATPDSTKSSGGTGGGSRRRGPASK